MASILFANKKIVKRNVLHYSILILNLYLIACGNGGYTPEQILSMGKSKLNKITKEQRDSEQSGIDFSNIKDINRHINDFSQLDNYLLNANNNSKPNSSSQKDFLDRCSGIELNSKEFKLEMLPDFYLNHIPNVLVKVNGNTRKKYFICSLLPHLYWANRNVLLERKKLEAMIEGELEWDEDFINELLSKYRVKNNSKTAYDELLLKVDVIPPSFLLAQGAEEGAWGSHRFPQKCNNTFGRHALKSEKVPDACRARGSSFKLKYFKNLQDAIENQIEYLNSHPNYKEFRSKRKLLRSKNMLNANDLFYALKGYAEKNGYSKRLHNHFKNNHLEKFDSLLIY